MKINVLLFACSAALFVPIPLMGNEDFDTIKQIRCDLLVVRLPLAKAVALQKELRDPKTVQQGVEKLLAMVEQDEAELVDWPSLTTKSGNRAVVENIREIRYPIEYETPKVVATTPANPNGVVVPQPTAPVPDDAPAGKTPPPPTPDPATPAPPTPGKDQNPTAQPGAPTAAQPGAPAAPAKPGQTITGASPTTFETKNIGVTLELEPTIGPDGKTIDMNLAPQHVSLIGYRRETFEVKGLYEMAVQQPIFDVQKVQTNITLKSGEAKLMGFYHVLEPKNTVELQILTATIIETKVSLPATPLPATAK